MQHHLKKHKVEGFRGEALQLAEHSTILSLGRDDWEGQFRHSAHRPIERHPEVLRRQVHR